MELRERLAKLVELNCREIIDPDHLLRVECVGGTENLLFEITCDQGDIGLIIGSNGRNIEAIRTLVKSACRGVSMRTDVEVLNSRRQ